MRNCFIYFGLLTVLLVSSCRKTEYASVTSPAYLRVFNCLEYSPTLDNKDRPQPFLTMLIDPVLDADGVPESAAIIGDFLEQRSTWARPYPDAGSNEVWQKEYPGTNRVLAAPILNGYDLSSWAQVPSGPHRVIFRTRPLNNTPFFELSKLERGVSLVDTTIDLSPTEVYTMQILIKDYVKNDPIMYLRHETFPKQPFVDSMVYVNFYNLSADGFFELAPNEQLNTNLTSTKLRDTMAIYYSLKKRNNSTFTALPGYGDVPMGRIIRSLNGTVTPYYSFPLFADTSSNKVFTGNLCQQFSFFGPGMNPQNIGYSGYLPAGAYSTLILGDYGEEHMAGNFPFRVRGDLRTGMIISIHSGTQNPRSFSTVNTVEYINRKFYVTTIQRSYAPPVYQ
ncbi:hypothetical protein DVR12_02375 [Chitinophaga silvatica]|uniref:Uncharacterized protein n=1 Tax=Chitinophaga silvatica TaxID=2282649 RepID=A0A3E1YGZ8_9BACT|nr:hypothetical protein [Chitinophaga silvatica]RFS26656.1 hypothetical protein DVR12_02375 [Chitinophaga silvatica]